MKTLLFGLATATAACASAPAPQPTQYPLCDREGGPACGNIGQVGRAAPTPQITRDANATFATRTSTKNVVQSVAETATTVIPKVTRVLVGASREMTSVTPFAGPRMDNREQYACGNVMSKGGSRKICRDGNGNRVDPASIPAAATIVHDDNLDY